jgi:hypothetical protein
MNAGYTAAGLTSFEIEKKPAIAEVEMSVVAVLTHVFKQLWIKDLNTEGK